MAPDGSSSLSRRAGRLGAHLRIVLVVLIAAAAPLAAQTPGTEEQDVATEPAPVAEESGEKSSDRVVVDFGGAGLELRSADGNFEGRFNVRTQFRAAYPYFDNPRAVNDLEEDSEVAFEIVRARFKGGGHAFRPWLDYYLEYDVVGLQLLDLRFTVERWDALNFRVGQWKPEYNRERRDSSGAQQFVDRSIANRTFTLDRQAGGMISGRLFEGRAFDSHYFAGALTGDGLGELDFEGEPMLFGRWQWNFTRRELGFSQSDIQRKPEPRGSLAFAAARNRSRFTRFSSDGGGELDGFPADVAERYDTEQWLLEAAYQRAGFSFQAEAHRKEVEDRLGAIGEGGVSVFEGGYAQAGYFFHGLREGFPEPLELALRFARVDATAAPGNSIRDEYTAAANWFFRGHDNKLTADLTRHEVEESGGSTAELRFRLQWDITF